MQISTTHDVVDGAVILNPQLLSHGRSIEDTIDLS
jgi:hypothetical protein